MNKIKLILMCIIATLTSCNGFGPLESNIQTKNIEISSQELSGTWRMDKFSYEYLSEFKKDSIVLIFKANKTFEMNNSKKLFDGEINNILSKGTWEIIEEFKTKKVKLNFDGSNLEDNLEIYKLGNDYQLWYYLSDPDSGERIRFLK